MRNITLFRILMNSRPGAIKTVSASGELISLTNRRRSAIWKTLDLTRVGSAKALQYISPFPADNIS
jgi:hypothetical protein